MKGSANIEFMISGFAFLSIVFYVLYAASGSLSTQFSITDSSIQRSRSYRLLMSLIMDSGSPPGWTDVYAAEKIGLASAPWVLNKSKVDAFFSACASDYTRLTKKIGAVFMIRIRNSTDTLYACPNSQERGFVPVSAVLDGEPVAVEVHVY